MAAMSVEDALAYLKSMSTTTGDDVFTHISEIVRSVLQAKVRDPVDIFETSFVLKQTRFVSREGEKPIKEGRDPKDVIPVKSFFALFNQEEIVPKVEEEKPKKKEGEEGEEEEVAEEASAEEDEEAAGNEFEAQNMLSDSVFFDACGCGIGRLDTYFVILALKQLGDDPKFGIETVRFFGKFFGINDNYYVFESTLKEGAGEEEEVPEEEEGTEGEEGGEGEEESGESKKKKGGWGRPSDGIPMEEGVGTNANVYWVCHRPGDQYKKLPPVTPLQINTARQLKKFLTGNLEAEVAGYPQFPGIEINYLRAQIARISHATQIAPSGYYSAADDEGGQTLTPAEDFEMPPAVDLGTLEAWVHKNAHIPKQGRCTKYEAPEEEGEGEEEEAPEEEEEEAKEGEEGEKDEDEEPEEPEEEPGSLRTLDQDKELADSVKAWSVTYSSSIKGLKHQVVCLRSHLWPGAFCVATPTGFSNIYVGYGLKNEAFKPTMPPPVQKEYAGEMVEATDLPPKPEPMKEEGEEKAGSEEEGEEEEEEEEE